MKIFMWCVRLVWILAIPVIIISSTVNIVISSTGLYQNGFDKYNISQVTNISSSELTEVASRMIDYLGGNSDTPQLKVNKNGKESLLYNEKELKHLADVREITDIFRFLQITSIVIIIITGALMFWKDDNKNLLNGMTTGAAITLTFTGILVIWSLVDFSSLFYLFHIFSFDNDLWLLDPAKDYLIMMFPEGFFYDAALLIVISVTIASILLLVVSVVLEKIFLFKTAAVKKTD